MARPVSQLKVAPHKKLTLELAFAQILRERRIALGLSQADLEDDDAVNRTYISKLELAQRQVCLRSFVHIARKINMSPVDLMAEVLKRVGDEG